MAIRKKSNDSGDTPKPRPSLADMAVARAGSSRSGKNRAAVLALQADIEAAVARGLAVREVYNTLVDNNWMWLKDHGYSDKAIKALDMGYETFRNICADLGIKKTPSRTRSKAARQRTRKSS